MQHTDPAKFLNQLIAWQARPINNNNKKNSMHLFVSQNVSSVSLQNSFYSMTSLFQCQVTNSGLQV